MKVIIDGVEYEPVKKTIQLEDHNFRVDSDGWKKITVNEKEYLESPSADIFEILDGAEKGEQLFTWESAMRETEKAGKRLPTDEEITEVLKTKEDLENITFPGHRNTDGSFGNQGSHTYIWSSSARGSDAWMRILYSGNSTVYRYTDSQSYGFSVRCVKE